MKLNNPFLLFLLLIAIPIFSQGDKQVYGQVVSNELGIKSVDIVNLNTKKNTTSDKTGKFTIFATVNDVLIFISDDYEDFRLQITHNHLNKNIIINLNQNPLELEEVKLARETSFKGIAGYEERKMAQLEKEQSRPKVEGVYTGEIVNGMDFVEIGRKLYNLFRSKKKNTINQEEEVDYLQFIQTVFNEEFFTKSLQLNPKQITPFLEYVVADDKVLDIISKKNKFDMINVLISKSEEFKKL